MLQPVTCGFALCKTSNMGIFDLLMPLHLMAPRSSKKQADSNNMQTPCADLCNRNVYFLFLLIFGHGHINGLIKFYHGTCNTAFLLHFVCMWFPLNTANIPNC